MISVIRSNAKSDRFRKYKIFVNKKVVAEIKNNEKKSFDLPEGVHEIFCKIDWVRSNKIGFHYTSKEEIVFDVVSDMDGFKKYFSILSPIIFFNSWIKMKKIN